MSVHFRKCIGEPYGANDLVDGLRWVGKRFMGKVSIEEYNGKRSNKIREVSPYGDAAKQALEPAAAAVDAEDEVRF